MKVKDLRSLFHEQLKDLYSAETQILDALPDMIDSARDSKLRNALQGHLEETRAQKKRLEKIGQSLDMKMKGHKCKGIEGIISEGEDLLECPRSLTSLRLPRPGVRPTLASSS